MILTCLSIHVTGQVVDTSKTINSWKLMHNYSRFEDTPLDTTIFDLHQQFNPLYRIGNAYEHTGIIGNAAQNIYFFDRAPSKLFMFAKAYYPIMADPDKTIFYNTRKPFTELSYSNIPNSEWGEETVRFLHTQNMDPFSNIGLDFEVLAGRKLYKNEDTKVTKFTLFGSRAKEKYNAFGSFHFNRFNNMENGGMENPAEFLKDSADWFAYNVNLSDAKTGYTNMKLFYTQKFTIAEKKYFTDSLGVTTDSGKNFSFNHQLLMDKNTRFYIDDFSLTNIPKFYDNYYYYDKDAKDSVVQDQIINTFQFILGDPYTDKLSARIYIGHEFTRFGQRSPEVFQTFDYYDTISYNPLVLDSVLTDTASRVFSTKFTNDIFVGFHMAGPPENKWYWNVDGKYYLIGYYRNNFKANATFSREIFKSFRLGIRGNIENKNPDYFYNHYSSAFFRWNNDFKATQVIRAEAFVTNNERRFEAVASTGILNNYLYWDENALPAQYEKVVYMLTGKLAARFAVSGFHSVNNLILQYTTANRVLKLPLIAVKTSNYWEQVLFKGALIAQFGLDFYITSPYEGNAYMPATGAFYIQNNQTIGGFPFVDAFLGFRIKRTRLFGSYCNGYSWLNNNFFTAANYPSRPRYVRLGLAWTFYD